jgi:demethylmenaquinone methyltransferase / 2-methoxy-6-polyprenyl-1,4-benzoquinol methylase
MAPPQPSWRRATSSSSPGPGPTSRRQPGPVGAGLPTGDDKRRAVRDMFDAIAERYELVNGIVALGLDRGWRRHGIDVLGLPAGSTVLDFACGTADLCRELQRRGFRPIGLDLSAGMLAHARTSSPLVLGDGLAAPFASGAFDGAVSGFALRNVVDLGFLFDELARAVRPGGRVSLLDLAEPENRVLRWGHRLWSNHAIPLVGSVLSNGAAYQYLPKSLAYLPATTTTVALLEASGFEGVQHELLSGGICQLFSATRRRSAHLAAPVRPQPQATDGATTAMTTAER